MWLVMINTECTEVCNSVIIPPLIVQLLCGVSPISYANIILSNLIDSFSNLICAISEM